MTQAGSSTGAGTAALQFRPDIQWTIREDARRWVAHDPITSAFYYFSEPERTVAELLDGRRTLDGILTELQQRFPGQAIAADWLLQLLGRFSAAELLLPAGPAAISRLLRKSRPGLARWTMHTLLSPLAVRVPLFDPSPMLRHARGLAAGLFHPVTMGLTCVAALILLVAVVHALVQQPQQLLLNLSRIQGERWLWMIGCYLAVKSLHELGHALACEHWRCQCRELGVMLLFFSPCLYCDTTDSWKLQSRWHRAAIAAAGIYVEMLLASLAALVWLVTRDGLAHSLAANVMLVCSFHTLLINGNPFLKYDGYYILSDLWGVPNLSEQGREASWSLLRGYLTAQPAERAHLDARLPWLAAYHLGALSYRSLVLTTILYLAWYMLVPLGLGFLAFTAIGTAAFGLILGSWKFLRRLATETLDNPAARRLRSTSVLALLLASVLFVALVPLPTSIRARATTDLADKMPVFAQETAELVELAGLAESGAMPGVWALPRRIAAGETLVRLHAPNQRYELVEIQEDLRMLREKQLQLERLTVDDASAAFELPTLRQRILELGVREELLRQDQAALHVTAPTGGILLPGPALSPATLAQPPDTRSREAWLTPRNLGSTVERGTLLGWFTPSPHVVLRVYVPEADLRWLRRGMPATCVWDSLPGNCVAGRIARIAPEPIASTPPALVGDPAFISLRDELGRLVPESPHYEVLVELELPQRPAGEFNLLDLPGLPDAPATVRFSLPRRSLLQSLWHALQLSLRPPRA
jgi:putative peptide zinc metalloprotease protein